MALFRKGTINMLLSKYNYKPGDSITGNLNLLMKKGKKPVIARGLSVALVCRETVTTRKRGETSTTTHDIFDLKIPLDGEKEYTGGAYEFDIGIPETILEGIVAPPEAQDGKGMKAAKAFRFLATGERGSTSRVAWYVVANLDIPRGLDVHKEAQITIG